MHVLVKRVRKDALLPTYATSGSSGMDLHAHIQHPEWLEPGDITLFPTGIALEMREGWEGQVRSRSGLSSRHGIQVVNAPGTIDSDYRGEVLIPLINLGKDSYQVQPGQRVAQLVFARVEHARFMEVDELRTTERGEGGFGSTDKTSVPPSASELVDMMIEHVRYRG